MKLIRLRSVANQAVRESGGIDGQFMIDPFYHHRPTEIITVNLLTGVIEPEHANDSVEKFYSGIVEWFHQVLPKEGIPIDIITSALLLITPQKKECIIKAMGRTFKSYERKKREYNSQDEKII